MIVPGSRTPYAVPVARDPLAVVRSMWDAYARNGLEAILDFAADDAVWIPYSAEGREFSSTAEYRRFIQESGDHGQSVESDAFEFEEHGDAVLVRGSIRVRRDGGIIDSSAFWVHRVAGGEVVWTRSFSTREDALAAI